MQSHRFSCRAIAGRCGEFFAERGVPWKPWNLSGSATELARAVCAVAHGRGVFLKEDLVYDKNSGSLRGSRYAIQASYTCNATINYAQHAQVLDGASVNRRLIRIHAPKDNKLVYKVPNRHASCRWQATALFSRSTAPGENHPELLGIQGTITLGMYTCIQTN